MWDLTIVGGGLSFGGTFFFSSSFLLRGVRSTFLIWSFTAETEEFGSGRDRLSYSGFEIGRRGLSLFLKSCVAEHEIDVGGSSIRDMWALLQFAKRWDGYTACFCLSVLGLVGLFVLDFFSALVLFRGELDATPFFWCRLNGLVVGQSSDAGGWTSDGIPMEGQLVFGVPGLS